jgi:hypothetical protein
MLQVDRDRREALTPVALCASLGMTLDRGPDPELLESVQRAAQERAQP